MNGGSTGSQSLRWCTMAVLHAHHAEGGGGGGSAVQEQISMQGPIHSRQSQASGRAG